jgi:peptidoglycan/LPS O-acetylase OafA/YrhL
MNSGFRADIEGLRALAVAPILMFHLSPALCPGGFAGVDIFFVISGFLITRMILADGAAFSLRRFYVRRLFRLLPALLVTLIATIAAGWFLLGPSDFVALAWSALAAEFAVSNFYFLAAVDYFNASSLSHPLLHTWSLGAEEQFYLLWPALIVAVGRLRLSFIAVSVAAALVSFLAVLFLRSGFPQAVFYLMPFRVFELALGACLAGMEAPLRQFSSRLLISAGGLGAAALAASFVLFDDNTPWPGLAALLPAVGTALLIIAGAQPGVGAVLASLPLRLLGRVSYALYLVHWPIIALYRQQIIIEPTGLELATMAAASLAAAVALHLLVEQPFRLRGAVRPLATTAGRWSGPPFLRLTHAAAASRLSGLVLGSCLASGSVIVGSGFPSRLNDQMVAMLGQKLTFAGDVCSTRASRCSFGDQSSSRIVFLLGDSHALNLLYGLDQFFRKQHIKGIAFYDHGCLFATGTKIFIGGVGDEDCRRHIEEAYAAVAGRTEPVILAGDYAGYRNQIGLKDADEPLIQTEQAYYAWVDARLSESLTALTVDNRRVVVMAQSYSTGVDLPRCLSQPGADKAHCQPLTLTAARSVYAASDRMIAELAARFPSVMTVDPKPAFCPAEPCTTQQGDTFLFRDTAHLTNEGSMFLIDRVSDRLLSALSPVPP